MSEYIDSFVDEYTEEIDVILSGFTSQFVEETSSIFKDANHEFDILNARIGTGVSPEDQAASRYTADIDPLVRAEVRRALAECALLEDLWRVGGNSPAYRKLSTAFAYRRTLISQTAPLTD